MRIPLLFAAAALLALAARAVPSPVPPVCDPRLATLFAPARSELGRYEVCTSEAPLRELTDSGWTVEPVSPLDAFGSAGAYDRAAVSRLYGGQRPTVARGWRNRGGTLESVTLISPHPDPTLSRLEPGTLIIRLIICCL